MTVTFGDVAAKIAGTKSVKHILYTVAGTAATWDQGYPADLARSVDPDVWEWQGVNYPATAFPMETSIAAGEAELYNLITKKYPDRTFAMIGYSQGAIVTSNIYDRLRNKDMQQYRNNFIGGVTFGNPRREEGHTIPGGIDNGGHGIVTPNLVNTEALWWDFADDSSMAGSPGDDLYCKTGKGENALAVEDMEAVWSIVNTGSFKSILGLAEEVLKILPNPINGGIAAIEAAFHALDFFVAEGITPHTSYQSVCPIAGDPRDCWRVALDYLNELGPSVPARKAA